MSKEKRRWCIDPTGPRGSGGFTLIELMVVIVILGLLAGLVLPNVVGSLKESTNETAEQQMKNISDAIQMYYLGERTLPTTLDDLTRDGALSKLPYMERVPRDPWKQRYDYKLVDAARNQYLLLSSGEDKTFGTEDDLVWPVKERNE